MERQLEELVASGKAGKMTEEEVRTRWPDAVVASLGALTQIKPDGTSKTRMLFDGTFGSGLNPRIRVRDKDRGPATADIKKVLGLQAMTKRRTLGITADVRDAHREIPVREADWKFQVCRAHPPPSSCYYLRCGVFGIASAAYWWGRLAAGLLRVLHHLGDPTLEGWLLLVADDFKIESTSTTPEISILFYLWVLVLLGVPLQWHKTKAGHLLDWVGLAFNLREHTLGLSVSRAAWAVAWCSRQASNGGGTLEELRAGVGRLGFAVGALTFDAPFLSPLYSYIGVCQSSGFRRYPVLVRLTLKFLAERIARRRSYRCGASPMPLDFGPRVDAAAEGDSIGIGGWLPRAGADGRPDTELSPWFALTLTRAEAPWAYSKAGQPFRTIAALEAMGTLLAIRLFSPWLVGGRRGAVVMRAYTDNQSNVGALGKLMTTKFPLNCITMEIAYMLEELDLRLDLQWLPRDRNDEADRLSKGILDGFKTENRLGVDPSRLTWNVLPSLMRVGEEFHQELQKQKGLGVGSGSTQRKRRKTRPLRESDPW